MPSEMTTAEMVRTLRTYACGREVIDAIATRLAALDKDVAAARARAEKAEALYDKAWEECEEWRRIAGQRSPNGWRLNMYRDEDLFPEADAHDAARKEAEL